MLHYNEIPAELAFIQLYFIIAIADRNVHCDPPYNILPP